MGDIPQNLNQRPAVGHVTTGPIQGSCKKWSEAPGRPDILVPYREIALHPSANEAPVRVYDTSGPYTDTSVTIDVMKGLSAPRAEWLAKRGFERVAARAVKPEDNGFASEAQAVPACPAPHEVYSGEGAQHVTQYEYARAGIITEEMIYIAHRENVCRAEMAEGAE